MRRERAAVTHANEDRRLTSFFAVEVEKISSVLFRVA
jgi:hypothetical protein